MKINTKQEREGKKDNKQIYTTSLIVLRLCAFKVVHCLNICLNLQRKKR